MVIAPVMVAAMVLLVANDGPFTLRFAIARSDFDHFVRDLPSRGAFDDWAEIESPGFLGTFKIRWAYQVGDMVLLYDSVGDFLNDSGFAYLPDGPDSRLSSGSFEARYFEHISGDWYTFTAGW